MERDDLKRDFEELIIKKIVNWSQKTKVKWAKEGDCNTSLFHRVASCRRNKNYIGSL